MTATLERDLQGMTWEELAELCTGSDEDLAAAIAECERRDQEDRAARDREAKAAKIRAASRERNGGWEAAAYANYLAADADCRGNLLSDAGRRTGREPWPMLWEGREERARLLASEDLERFWDYVTPRPPSPGEYATAEREAVAEQRARQDMPSPGMLAAIAAARGEAGESPAPVAARTEPGSLVRFTAMLRRTRAEVEALTEQTDRYARVLARVNGGAQK